MSNEFCVCVFLCASDSHSKANEKYLSWWSPWALAKNIVLLLLEQLGGSHAISGQGSEGCVGGDCQQLLVEKLVYCQQPCPEIKTSLVSRSHPHSSRQRLAQTLNPTAGVPRVSTQGWLNQQGNPGGHQDSWENSHGATQPNTPSAKVQCMTPSPD